MSTEGKSPLAIFGIASDRLSDYLTSEKDMARKICRMPTEDFLLQGKLPFGNDKEDSSSQLASGQLLASAMSFGDDEDAEEMFDDFVIIEKPDMLNKYNQKDKLAKHD